MASSREMESVDGNILERLDLPKPLILGSGSFTRQLILKEMGIDYVIAVRPIDEQGVGDRIKDTPHDLVLTLAKAKADHLVQQIQQGNCEKELQAIENKNCFVVLTGDQVVVHAGTILEKPSSVVEAESFCARYAESPPSTVGSCVLTHIPSNLQVAGVDTATIHFRPTVASCNLVQQLVMDGAPILSCAGGLMIEHELVKQHIERIDGTEDSVMGLSKALVRRLLSELAHRLKEQS
jgi:septum formation protein